MKRPCAFMSGLLAQDPSNAAALAGLANALTQRVIRWGWTAKRTEPR
jgi:hypothetical protein